MQDTPLRRRESLSETDEVRRAKLKTAASLRAQINYKHAMERIDFRLDTIEPALKKVALEVVTIGEIPEFIVAEEDDDGQAPEA
jgi:hypothetical protein